MLLKKFNLSFLGLKTLWEKEKILGTGIFSFSHNVFNRLFPKGCQKLSFHGRVLTFSQTTRLLITLKKSPLKIMREKEKMLVNNIFVFPHSVFYPSQNTFYFSIKFLIHSFKCIEIGLVQIFVIW